MPDNAPMPAAPPAVDWHARARALLPDGRLVIDGQRRSACSEETFANRSPIDGRTVAPLARGQAADVNAAVQSARQAFDDGRWAHQSPAQRKRVLLQLADAVHAAREELALLECLEVGKPIAKALAADLGGTVRCLRWYAEAIDKVYGEVAPTGRDALALIQREAMGVVGCIVPWNYPLLMAVWKLAPALAMGNSVVLKPSEKSPLSALRLAELAVEAGLPPGVLNVVPGFGQEAGESLARHPDVDAIGFTGSTRIGRRMLQCAAESNLKRVYNELGGKSAVLIFPDCPDLPRAAQALAEALFYNAGQSCNAPSRILVHASVADAFASCMVEETARWQPGDPLLEDTAMGAIVDDGQLRRVLDHVRSGTGDARLLAGGCRAQVGRGGCFMQPTVFADVPPTATIAREEIFGPVASLLRFDDEAQAVALANDSVYGLQASVWSSDISRAHRVARALRAGTVHVNQYNDDDITVPFGGYKQSGNGRDKSLHALDKYTELKTTWIRIDD